MTPTKAEFVDELIEYDQDSTIKDYLQTIELVEEFETICQINTQKASE